MNDLKFIITKKEQNNNAQAKVPKDQAPLVMMKPKKLKKKMDSMLDDQSEELKQPLLEGANLDKPFKKLLSSQNTVKILRSKLTILESTLVIIDEALLSLKYSSSYAVKVKDRIRTVQYETDLQNNLQNDYVKT